MLPILSLNNLMKLVEKGWPNDKSKLNREFQQFSMFRGEIICVNDILFKSNKIIVQKKKRKSFIITIWE